MIKTLIILFILASLFEISFQAGLSIDLNKEPPQEPANAFQSISDVNVQSPILDLDQSQIHPFQNQHPTKSGSTSSDNRSMSSHHRKTKIRSNIPGDAKAEARMKALETIRQAGIVKSSNEYNRTYRNTYRNTLTALGHPYKSRNQMNKEELEHIRELSRRCSKTYRDKRTQRKLANELTPTDKAYYAKAILRKQQSRQKKKQERQEQLKRQRS